MRKQSKASRFAERELHGFDEAGVEERIVVWIERMQGGTWAVGPVGMAYGSANVPRVASDTAIALVSQRACGWIHEVGTKRSVIAASTTVTRKMTRNARPGRSASQRMARTQACTAAHRSKV